MNNVITFFSLMIISSNLFASDLSDITCGVTHNGIKTEKKLSDSGNSDEGKWTNFKLDDSSQSLSIACGGDDDVYLNCTIRTIDNKNKSEPKVLGVRTLAAFNISLGDGVSVYCHSAELFDRLLDTRSNEPTQVEVKTRTLTNDELSFCSGLQDFGSSLLIDFRALCVPFLKTLPRSLTRSELEYCKRQYSVDFSSSYDHRLQCTEELM